MNSNHITEVERETISSQGKKKRRRLRLIPMVLLVLVVFFSFGYLGFYLAGATYRPLNLPPLTNPLQALLGRPQPVNILLLGTDQRGTEPARADTILVAFVDPAIPRVNLISIPRDTYTTIPEVGETKINHAHAYGGPELTMDTVESLLGVPVDRYVEVNFEGFEKIIDLLGGVEIEVDRRMHYPPENIDLQPGRQVLDGEDALAFVRFRGYPEGDIARIEHQQEFLTTLADQALQAKNIFKTPQILQEMRANVKTNLKWEEMLSLAEALRSMEPGNLKTATLPGEPDYIRGVSYWIPDAQAMEELVASFSVPDPSNRALGQEVGNIVPQGRHPGS